MATREMLSNVLSEELWKLARACRILKMEGHGDLTMGHMSLRDPEGRGFWMKRAAIGLGEVRDADDFILLDFDGNRLYGDGDLHIEWPLHGEIIRGRPDIDVVGHSHPFHAATFSATKAPLRSVAHDGAMLGEAVPYYVGTSALIDSPELGREVVQSLGQAPAILMRNHGISYCGKTAAQATMAGIFIEKACRAQLMLSAANMPWTWPEPDEFEIKAKQLASPNLRKAFWGYFNRELDRTEGVRGITDRVETPAA